jgi:hypothetical protein
MAYGGKAATPTSHRRWARTCQAALVKLRALKMQALLEIVLVSACRRAAIARLAGVAQGGTWDGVAQGPFRRLLGRG